MTQSPNGVGVCTQVRAPLASGVIGLRFVRAGLTPLVLSWRPWFKPERLSQTVPCVGDSHRPRPVANDNTTQMVKHLVILIVKHLVIPIVKRDKWRVNTTSVRKKISPTVFVLGFQICKFYLWVFEA